MQSPYFQSSHYGMAEYTATGQKKLGFEHTFSDNQFIEISLNENYNRGVLFDLFDLNSGIRL